MTTVVVSPEGTPPPIEPARLAEPHEIPRSASQLALKAQDAGWRIAITYARGYWPHGHPAKTQYKEVVTIAVRLRKKGRTPLIGAWVDGSFEGGYAADLRKLSSAELTKEVTRPDARP